MARLHGTALISAALEKLAHSGDVWTLLVLLAPRLLKPGVYVDRALPLSLPFKKTVLFSGSKMRVHGK